MLLLLARIYEPKPFSRLADDTSRAAIISTFVRILPEKGVRFRNTCRYSLSTRMSLVMNTLQTLSGKVGVDLRRGKGAVPEHLLNAAQIRAPFQQIARKGMAHIVG